IESALAAIDTALQAQPLDPAAVRNAYAHLNSEAAEAADRLGGAPGAPAAPAAAAAQTPSELLKTLSEAREAIARGDAADAATEIDAFARAWPAVEGAIATR